MAWKSLVLGVAFLAAVVGSAEAARVALVIGNDQYENLPDLKKAVADAGTYAELLESQGFDEVMLRTDLTRAAIDEAIATFLDRIAPGDTAVFAYSGHGWSDGAQNYLVGTDAPAGGKQELLARLSIPLKNGATGVLDDMDRRGAGLKVAIIDACRDNPFTAASGTRSAGLSRGLTRIEPPSGTFVVLSAGAGQTALDRLSDADADPNSVFTRVFVPLIRSGLTLQEATKAAQAEVVKLARSIDHEQKPAYYDEVLGNACLSGTCQTATATVAPAATPVDDAAAAYQAALAQNSIEAWDAFLKYHPDGFYADLARAARKKLGFGAIAALPKIEELTSKAPAPAKVTVPPEIITECDRLAAIVLDPDKPVTLPGYFEVPGAEAAVAACRDAVAAHPDVRRFKGQLGFALKSAGQLAEARDWLEKAAADGHVAAMMGLVEMYVKGVGVAQDVAEGLRWTEKAAAGGSLVADVALLEGYAAGRGPVGKDEAKAKLQAEKVIPLLNQAADAGDPDAPAILGVLNLVGGGIDVNAAKGGAYLVEAVGRGSRIAAGFLTQSPETLPVELRLSLEQLLADRGFSPGPVDGVIDEETKAALDALARAAPQAAAEVASLEPNAPAGTAATAKDGAQTERATFRLGTTDAGESAETNEATVAWSFLADGEFGPELRADLEVPDRGLKVQFSIRKNAEAGFPASHIIAVNTDRSGDLRGEIASVPGIILKATEDAAGERLIGASTKVAPGYFWIALSGTDSDLARNMELLREGEWIDMPLVGRGGRRALLTFPKGPEGREAMARAFAAWDSLAKQ